MIVGCCRLNPGCNHHTCDVASTLYILNVHGQVSVMELYIGSILTSNTLVVLRFGHENIPTALPQEGLTKNSVASITDRPMTLA